MRPIGIPDTFPQINPPQPPHAHTYFHKIGGLCRLNSIGAQIAGVFLGCARVHSACGAPQVAKTGNINSLSLRV